MRGIVVHEWQRNWTTAGFVYVDYGINIDELGNLNARIVVRTTKVKLAVRMIRPPKMLASSLQFSSPRITGFLEANRILREGGHKSIRSVAHFYTNMSKPRLDGKVAIITGASSGIGEAAARVFTEHGAFVVAADIQDDLGGQVVESIGSEKCCYRHCDLADEIQVQETVAYTIEKYGRVDILFSNAGVMGRPTSIMEMDLEELDRIVAVNMRGSAAFIKHVARVMVDSQTRGSIICTTSIASIVGGLSPHSYSISKHALLGLVRSAAAELGKHGIRVNCISPSVVPTRMSRGGVDGWNPPMEEFVLARSNLKGILLKPSNVAEAALFLASDESCFVSGHNLVVDGGFTVVDHSFGIFK